MPTKQHSIAILLIKLGAQANISMLILAAITYIVWLKLNP